MDQAHEDHLARILENRRRRGVLGVYSSDASKRLAESARQPLGQARGSSVTAGTQTRAPPPPPTPPTKPTASYTDDTTSPLRPFRYPASAGRVVGQGPAATSPGSLFDTILNESTADLHSEEGEPQPFSALMSDERRENDGGGRGRWGPYKPHVVIANDALTKKARRLPPAASASFLDGPGWQRSSPLREEGKAATAAPSQWRSQQGQSASHNGHGVSVREPEETPYWRRGAAPSPRSSSTERVPMLAYHHRGGDARGSPVQGVQPSQYAAPPTRDWSSPRAFTSSSGLLQTPRWRDGEAQSPTRAADHLRWRASSTPEDGRLAAPRRHAFDPNRTTHTNNHTASNWFSSTLNEAYPLPITRDDEDPFAARGPSANLHLTAFSGRGESAMDRPAHSSIGTAVRWTDEQVPPTQGGSARRKAGHATATTRARSHRRAASSSSSSSSSSTEETESSAPRRHRRHDRSRSRRGRTSTSKYRHRSRSQRRDRHRPGDVTDESNSRLSEGSGRDGTAPPSVEDWARRGASGAEPRSTRDVAGAVVYTGNLNSGAAPAFPLSRNQPPKHPPRVRTYYEEAPIGLPDVRSTIDIRTSVQVLMSGDWFYKWDRKGNAVHQRWVWVDVKSYLLVWSRKETHDSLFSGSVPLETISQVTPRELVQVDADGLPRNYYVLMIETTRRVLQIATERKEKADVWYEALNNIVAFVRRREMNKGALIPD